MIGVPEWAIGVGVIILCASVGGVMVRVLASVITRPGLRSGVTDPTGRGQVLEDVQARIGELDQLTRRVGELEERVDFTERLLAKQREGPRLGSSQDKSVS